MSTRALAATKENNSRKSGFSRVAASLAVSSTSEREVWVPTSSASSSSSLSSSSEPELARKSRSSSSGSCSSTTIGSLSLDGMLKTGVPTRRRGLAGCDASPEAAGVELAAGAAGEELAAAGFFCLASFLSSTVRAMLDT